tara:strand:+ start:777 stop:983 length:207 start_codon:yes stop_codon:yes gene_type:complete
MPCCNCGAFPKSLTMENYMGRRYGQFHLLICDACAPAMGAITNSEMKDIDEEDHHERMWWVMDEVKIL